MAITQIPIDNFSLTAFSNEFTTRQASSDLTDRDEQRRREANRSRSQSSPRMRQAQQAQRLSEAMLKEHAASALLPHHGLKSTINDLLSGDGRAADDRELLLETEFRPAKDMIADLKTKGQPAADQKTFQNVSKVENHLGPTLSDDKKSLASNEKNIVGEKSPVEKVQPFDMAARISDLGSMQGRGKTNLAVRQMTEQLKDFADALAALKKEGSELNEEESAQLAWSVDFLEGYCEASAMDAQARAQLDATLQSLRSNLNPVVQANIAEAALANGDAVAELTNPTSVVAPRQRAAREALLKGDKAEGGTQPSGGIERNRKALMAQYSEKKQNEDTLPLIVQRSI